jgi:hypothetical protein
MVTWLVLGVLVFAVVLLGLVTLPVLSRVGALARSAGRIRRQVQQAQTLQMSLAHLQERLGALQEHAAAVQQHLVDRRDSPRP